MGGVNLTGVYGILDEEGGGVRSADAQFGQVYADAGLVVRKDGKTKAPPPGTEVKVAVVDSGVVTHGDTYFGDRTAGSFSALGAGWRLTNGLPATEGQHGAHVASIAASGTSMIKIIDVQVCSTQEGGKVELSVWRNAFDCAIAQGARVVNVSIVCPWKELKDIVAGNTGVLFLATSGNACIKFDDNYRTENGFDSGNVILVGGCNRDGSRHNQRGFGEGIDVFVPSVDVPGYVAKRFVQHRDYPRAVKLRDEEDQKLNRDRQEIATLKAKLEVNPTDTKLTGQLSRAQKRLDMGVSRLPQVSASEAEYPVGEFDQLTSDSGVSFGIPMVANVAAKMMLILPNLTPRETIAIMRATAGQNGDRRVLSPVACYKAALEARCRWALRI